jgi:peptidase C3-like protein
MNMPVPFYSNTPDDSHCFQAALRMILAYYMPWRSYSWGELDRITAHTSRYTWPTAGLLYCASIGFAVTLIQALDYTAFGESGYAYLLRYYGREVAHAQLKNSAIPQEIAYAKQLRGTSIEVQTRIPEQRDVRSHLASGALVICNVNSRRLNGRTGYAGHFVVIKGINEAGIWLHDPGLPPLKDRFVQWQQFERAWAYPDVEARNVISLSLPEALRRE